MDLSITQVPTWLSVVFVLTFSTFPIILIANIVSKVYAKGTGEKNPSIRNRILLFYWVYFALVSVISITGVFAVNTIPPLIVMTTALPLFLFYLVFVSRTSWFRIVVKHITLEQLVFIHVFRFVGVFFLLVYAYGALPREFALIGGIGDILTALLVFPVVSALKKGKSYARTFTWVWNFIGLFDIISVLFTATLVTQQAMGTDKMAVQQFGTFPFSWIPAFAPATIIFFHLIVFQKLLKARK